MNRTFQVIGLPRSCLDSFSLTPFVLTKWLTQIFVDCSRFSKAWLPLYGKHYDHDTNTKRL